MKKIVVGLVSIVFSTTVLANSDEYKIISFLKKSISKDVIVEKISILETIKIQNNWNIYSISVKIKDKEAIKDTFFSNGLYITNNLFDINRQYDMHNELIKSDIHDLPKKMYNNKSLIFKAGSNENDFMIISDPLCPICLNFMNTFFDYLEKNGDVNSNVYYYSFPLQKIHPTSLYISALLSVLKESGTKDVYKRYYREAGEYIGKNKEIITFKSSAYEMLGNIFDGGELEKINLKDSLEEIERNSKIIRESGISGTPIVYFNHKIDLTRNRFFQLKGE